MPDVEIPPCTGCSSPLCPDCAPVETTPCVAASLVSEADRDAFAEVFRAARRRYLNEHPEVRTNG